ncbi:unnamed protein product [Heligmosomoides polygyrus]|uniref:G_PROTEIN_RECEP_F1_2 domain-containing protein n=1 Tax=Heligmosomoides polygyrus TaxID=6339 RepID=A0A183FTH3_HELPZ|nr:unnamed protein product [Heligmosomoides polygyrus]
MVKRFLIVIVNIPLLLTILFRKQNRSRREFLLIGGMALGDGIYAFGFFLSITRFFESFGTASRTTTRLDCMAQWSTIAVFLGATLIGQMNTVVALDRFLAVIFPIWYFQTTMRYPIIVLTLAYGLSILALVLNWILVLTNENERLEVISSQCNFVDSTYPGFRDILMYYRWFCIIVAAIMCIAVASLLRKRYKATSRLFVPSTSKIQNKKVMRTNVTMGS